MTTGNRHASYSVRMLVLTVGGPNPVKFPEWRSGTLSPALAPRDSNTAKNLDSVSGCGRISGQWHSD